MNRTLNVRGLATFPKGDLESIQMFNRTGGNTVAGGVYVVDTPQEDGDSTDAEKGADNILGVTTARMNRLQNIVVAKEVVADNVEVNVIRGSTEGTVCRVLVDGTADVAKGDKLKLVNAQVYLVKATTNHLVDEAAALALDHYVAEALEAYTTDATQTLLLVRLFDRPYF
jgi:hypothetical protein